MNKKKYNAAPEWTLFFLFSISNSSWYLVSIQDSKMNMRFNTFCILVLFQILKKINKKWKYLKFNLYIKVFSEYWQRLKTCYLWKGGSNKQTAKHKLEAGLQCFLNCFWCANENLIKHFVFNWKENWSKFIEWKLTLLY